MMIMHGTSDHAIAYDGPSSSTTDANVTTTEYGGCRANSDVVLVSIEGGEHVWPRFATHTIWSFFEQHTLTGPRQRFTQGLE